MPNPRPDLQGFADPSTEGWRERALARVAERAQIAKRRNGKGRTNGMYLLFDDGLRPLLDEAAKRRNISLTGYGRRAMIAMIAYDLGMDIEDVAQFAAVPAGYGESGGGRLSRTSDNGRGMGPWIITDVRE